jgi:hypothetical protein
MSASSAAARKVGREVHGDALHGVNNTGKPDVKEAVHALTLMIHAAGWLALDGG